MPRTLINLLLVLGVLAALVLGVVLGLGLGGVAVTLWRYKYWAGGLASTTPVSRPLTE